MFIGEVGPMTRDDLPFEEKLKQAQDNLTSEVQAYVNEWIKQKRESFLDAVFDHDYEKAYKHAGQVTRTILEVTRRQPFRWWWSKKKNDNDE